jgi:class 3 adenylate cyclase
MERLSLRPTIGRIGFRRSVSSEAAGGEILASSLVRQLAEGSGEFSFGETREVELKGLTGPSPVCSVAW